MRASRVSAAVAAGVLGALGTLAAPAVAAPGTGTDTGTAGGGNTAGTSQQTPAPKPTKPPPDTQAPPAPLVGDPVVEAGGKVTLPVAAEKGAHVVVTELGAPIAQIRANAQSQQLHWTATSGSHTYSLTATDKAGNESAAATVTIDVDADPPVLRNLVIRPGTSRNTTSVVGFTTEPNTTYSLLVDGNEVKSGTTPSSGSTRITADLDLANGEHPVAIHLQDETGNTTDQGSLLRVRISGLALDATVVSHTTDPVQVVEITSAPGVRGVLSVPGEPEHRFLVDAKGKARVEIPLEDGTYDGATVRVEDGDGRKGSETLPEITVDTTPPVLEVHADGKAADDGALLVEVTADKGSIVVWRVLDGKTEITAGKYVAVGGPKSVGRNLDKGSYTFEVTATDVYGRRTTKQVDVDVAADPIPAKTWVLAGLGALLLLLVLGWLLSRLWRRHQDKVAERRLHEPVKATKENVAAYERAEAAWAVRHRELTRLAEVAGGSAPSDIILPDGFSLLPDEQPLWVTGARLLEIAQSGGHEAALETASGHLVVTSMRLAFTGEQHRDWWLSLVERMRHLDHERTILRLHDGDSWSGVAYDDPELTRSYVDLALAEHDGKLDTYRGVVTRGLRDHEMRRPSPPGT